MQMNINSTSKIMADFINPPNKAMQLKTPFGSFFNFDGYSKFPTSVDFPRGVSADLEH
jgi:hypothetical protein